jgi:hypothetical protein
MVSSHSPIIPFRKFVDVNDYLLSENWEKKLPHLRASIEAHLLQWTYHQKLKQTTPEAFEQQVDDILIGIYNSDPVCLKTNGKKTPFANLIWLWRKNDSIIFPEDTQKVRALIQQYRDRKTRGEILDPIEEFKMFGDLYVYLKENEEAQEYGEYLDLVGESGLWRVYKISEWPQAQKALKDSSWCVKHFPNFDSNSYTPKVFFLVCSKKDNEKSTKEKRFALIHIQSNQIHNTKSKDISGELPQDLAELLLSIPECIIAPPVEGSTGYSRLEYIGTINEIGIAKRGVDSRFGDYTKILNIIRSSGINSIEQLSDTILNDFIINAINANPAMMFRKSHSPTSVLANITGRENQHNMVRLFKERGIYDEWVDNHVLPWCQEESKRITIPLNEFLILFGSPQMGTPKSYTFLKDAYLALKENNSNIQFKLSDSVEPMTSIAFGSGGSGYTTKDISNFFNHKNGSLKTIDHLLEPPPFDPHKLKMSKAQIEEFGEIVDEDIWWLHPMAHRVLFQFEKDRYR